MSLSGVPGLLTEEHCPDKKLSKLFRYVHLVNSQLLQVVSQNVC
jgi:hypothetical protein